MVFSKDMYNNLYGSIIITNYILSEDKDSIDTTLINKKWRKFVKGKSIPESMFIENENFITNTLDYFMVPLSSNLFGNCAYCISNFNHLIMPYIDNQIYPLREDGVIPTTARIGKIYPIKKVTNE